MYTLFSFIFINHNDGKYCYSHSQLFRSSSLYLPNSAISLLFVVQRHLRGSEHSFVHFHLVHLRQCLWISLQLIKLLGRFHTGTLNLPIHLYSVLFHAKCAITIIIISHDNNIILMHRILCFLFVSSITMK